jgi:hypothetical protein
MLFCDSTTETRTVKRDYVSGADRRDAETLLAQVVA